MYFRSRDKDGGHISRSAIAENPTLHANLTVLSMEPKLLPIVVGNSEFSVICCYDLDLDPMTFIYELDLYLVKMSPQIKNELSTSRRSKVT